MAGELGPGKEAGGSHVGQAYKELDALLKLHLEEALLHRFRAPGRFTTRDFGCGSGGQTLNYAKFMVEVLKTKPELTGREIVCHFADLPSNDINALFNLLPPVVGHGVSDGSAE
jgi:hypothetical protein